MAALLILLSNCANLAEGVFIKKYNSRHQKGGFLFTALISLFAMVFFLITDTGGLQFPPELFLYGIISGILYCSASFLTYVALGCGSFALSMLILSYSLVFSIGYGLIFLKETATVFTWLGLGIMLISLYLTRADKKEGSIRITPKWLICIGLSVIGSGMFAVVSRMQQIRFQDANTNEFMILSLGLSAAILLLLGILKDGKDLKYILKYGSGYAISAGLLNGACNLLGLIVNTMIPLSIAAPSKAGTKIILSFLMSRLIFKEKFLPRQVIGVMLGAAALVLLNL